MIDSPAIILHASESPTWSADGPLAERALTFALQINQTIEREHPGLVLPPRRLHVLSGPREHVGLGVGTQLGLAVASLLARSWGLNASLEKLAQWTQRGQRSALGVHGFAQGGFLVEAGKRQGGELSPLVARMDFPAAWRVLMIVPRHGQGLWGSQERSAFTQLATPPAVCAELSQLVLLGMLPALAERDLEVFGEAVHVYNARVGEVFARVQGGTYCNPQVAELIAFVRQQGVRGVGQSSWGPGVFALAASEEQARELAERVSEFLGEEGGEYHIARGVNVGASVSEVT